MSRRCVRHRARVCRRSRWCSTGAATRTASGDNLSPLELRDLVQWTVKPQILAVPGIAQAQIFGGEVRERQIEVDPVKLAAANLSIDDVLATAKRATALIGGGFLETPNQRIVIQAQAPGATPDALAGGGGRSPDRA